jgi:CDGSH-type Zn-finger protein
MSEPKIADRRPMVIELEPGTYWWCACGRSANQPFCDGSHRGTGFVPLSVDIAEPCRKALCMCKHTADQPFCDGSHNRL